MADQAGHAGERGLALPPASGEDVAFRPVTAWSVDARQYGNFLVEIFEEWVRHDVGRIFVQLFDVALGNWMGLGSSLCIFAEKCGAALALEHNGDVYSCDHYVYPHYQLGNILNKSLGEMANSPEQRHFGVRNLPRCQIIAGNAMFVSPAMVNARRIVSSTRRTVSRD
jgi:uncharacterized protein